VAMLFEGRLNRKISTRWKYKKEEKANNTESLANL